MSFKSKSGHKNGFKLYAKWIASNIKSDSSMKNIQGILLNNVFIRMIKIAFYVGYIKSSLLFKRLTSAVGRWCALPHVHVTSHLAVTNLTPAAHQTTQSIQKYPEYFGSVLCKIIRWILTSTRGDASLNKRLGQRSLACWASGPCGSHRGRGCLKTSAWYVLTDKGRSTLAGLAKAFMKLIEWCSSKYRPQRAIQLNPFTLTSSHQDTESVLVKQ